MKGRSGTTLREIAELSGVSIATVSRALSGDSRVSPAVRERVTTLAGELEYTPNAAARTLVMQRSDLLAVVIRSGDHREFQHPFFQVVLDGVKRQATARGYDLLLLSHQGEGYGNDAGFFVARARRHQVSGAVVIGVTEEDVAALARFKIPVMTVDLEPPPGLEAMVGRVESDNVRGGKLAVEHLHSLGRTRIATITGMLHTPPGRRRLEGYREAASELELAVPDGYVQEADFSYAAGSEAMRALLDLPEPPDAVCAASDHSALGAIRAISEAGLRVPEDIAVVGFDDIAIAGLTHPALTTVRQDKERIGEVVCSGLIDFIEGTIDRPPSVTLPVELVVRESCGAGLSGDAPSHHRPDRR